MQKSSSLKKISSFIYDNSLARLYFIDNKLNNQMEVKISDNDLKRIRNGCYWGVASSR
jgi:hypothetical protein